MSVAGRGHMDPGQKKLNPNNDFLHRPIDMQTFHVLNVVTCYIFPEVKIYVLFIFQLISNSVFRYVESVRFLMAGWWGRLLSPDSSIIDNIFWHHLSEIFNLQMAC